jgi:hypothetical protein
MHTHVTAEKTMTMLVHYQAILLGSMPLKGMRFFVVVSPFSMAEFVARRTFPAKTHVIVGVCARLRETNPQPKTKAWYG